jgi:hypothetical protein
MGTLSPPFNLDFIKCDAYLETGTGQCNSLFTALRSKIFKKCYSIDIDTRIVENARKLLPSAEIFLGESTFTLSSLLRNDLKQYNSILFFLDAHFPGADYFNEKYDINAPNAIPLKQELELIKKYRNNCKDVIICDDARIYSDKWNWEAGQLFLVKEGCNWLFEMYPNTLVFTHGEGYFLIDNRFI